MRYLKLFEDLNEDGYEEMNIEDFYTSDYERLNFTTTTFTEKELSKLLPMGLSVADMSSFEYLYTKGIFLYKASDEWYYIEKTTEYDVPTKDSFFKCDQWDSVIACLIKEFKFIESSRWDIKQFEELKHDHYELYGYDEISDFNITSVDFTPFSEKELHKLSEINFTVRSKDDSSWLGKSVSYRGDTGSLIIMIFNKGDEWYYVRVRDGRTSRVRCYKCDQWDGLIGCLRNQGGLDV